MYVVHLGDMASADMLKGYKVFSVIPRLKLRNGAKD